MTDEERKATIDQDAVLNVVRDGLMAARVEREKRILLEVFGVTEKEVEGQNAATG